MRHFLSPSLLPLLLLALLPVGNLAAEPVIHRGSLAGAPYEVVVPAAPIRGTILLAHGYRPEDAPVAVVIEHEKEPYATWLAEGWVLAASAYRRNGWILGDAIKDLELLRAWLEIELELTGPIYLNGESMGGAILTQIVEDPTLARSYAGALVLSAALYPERFGFEPSWTHSPHIPALFMSNEDEMAPIERYAQALPTLDGSKVALWEVARPGHVNFEAEEELKAMAALDQWVETGKIAHRFDPTVAPPAFASQAVWAEDGKSAESPVLRIDPTFGNTDTALTTDDFERLGIPVGAQFTVSAGENAFTALRGVTYADVERGEWLAVALPDGQMRIVINFGNAAKALDVAVGDTLKIEAVR